MAGSLAGDSFAMELGMEVEGETKISEKAKSVVKRKRNKTRPPLSRSLINIMIDFLLQEDRRPVPEDTPVWTRAWAELLKEDTEIKTYVKGLTLRQRFINWIRVLDVAVSENGEATLCIAGSKKIVPSKEEIPKIIRDAHRMTGEFKGLQSRVGNNYELVAGRSSNAKHNSFKNVMKLVREKYAFGSREFGIRQLAIYREILRCPECYAVGRLRIPGRDVIQKAEIVDPDFGNEMNYISLNNAPISFLKKGPSRNSVWFDQTGLASEGSVYKKLLGVIEEVGIEIGKTTQNDELSKERLITKLCCAEKLVKDLKTKTVEVFAFRIPRVTFFHDFEKLQREYVAQGNIALFLQDMNYLMNMYKNFRNEVFIDFINDTLNHLVKDQNCSLRVVPFGDGFALEGTEIASSLETGNSPTDVQMLPVQAVDVFSGKNASVQKLGTSDTVPGSIDIASKKPIKPGLPKTVPESTGLPASIQRLGTSSAVSESMEVIDTFPRLTGTLDTVPGNVGLPETVQGSTGLPASIQRSGTSNAVSESMEVIDTFPRLTGTLDTVPGNVGLPETVQGSTGLPASIQRSGTSSAVSESMEVIDTFPRLTGTLDTVPGNVGLPETVQGSTGLPASIQRSGTSSAVSESMEVMDKVLPKTIPGNTETSNIVSDMDVMDAAPGRIRNVNKLPGSVEVSSMYFGNAEIPDSLLMSESLASGCLDTADANTGKSPTKECEKLETPRLVDDSETQETVSENVQTKDIGIRNSGIPNTIPGNEGITDLVDESMKSQTTVTRTTGIMGFFPGNMSHELEKSSTAAERETTMDTVSDTSVQFNAIPGSKLIPNTVPVKPGIPNLAQRDLEIRNPFAKSEKIMGTVPGSSDVQNLFKCTLKHPNSVSENMGILRKVTANSKDLKFSVPFNTEAKGSFTGFSSIPKSVGGMLETSKNVGKLETNCMIPGSLLAQEIFPATIASNLLPDKVGIPVAGHCDTMNVVSRNSSASKNSSISENLSISENSASRNFGKLIDGENYTERTINDSLKDRNLEIGYL